MPYTHASIPSDHSEFGGGAGMIDPVMRADRVFADPAMQLWEIYATNPSAGAEATGSTPEEIAINKALGELQSKPETSVVERP